jgi:NAD(P)-dependent dehydrogenase (short-subunit alcohol dehydrogenase family)
MGTICITGSASGIGAATKARLEARGHRVIGVDLRNADVEADLSTDEGRAVAVAGVLDRCDGVLDGLVPGAGLSDPHPAPLTAAVNYFGAIATVEGLHPALARGTSAAVVMISSNSTTMMPNIPIDKVDRFLAGDVSVCDDVEGVAYYTSKLAIAYWMRSRAVTPEWIGAGIRLNAVAPGVTDTNMTRPLLELEGVKEAMNAIPLPIGRWAQPDEIAAVIEFLLGPDAGYIVGQTIFVDGGTDALLQPRGYPVPLNVG